MTESLALKYRPRKFADVVGQKITAVVLDRMVATEAVPQGLLFSGPRGSGKTSVARILANSLDAGEPIEVDAASHGLVDDVRQMIESLRFSSGHKHRVVIYDEAHSMSKEAFNALLKTLEEPPSGTIFVLVTTEPERVPENVKSRLMEFTFRKISASEILGRVQSVSSKENISVTSELVTLISERADGSLRDALTMLDQCARAGIQDAGHFLEMMGEGDVAPHLVLAMLTGNHEYIFEKADELSQRMPDPNRLTSAVIQVLKDALILRAGGETTHSGDSLALRKEISSNLEPERVVAALRILWDLRTRVRASVDPRGNLDLAIVLITEIFTQGRTPLPVPEKPVEAPRKLTFDEL